MDKELAELETPAKVLIDDLLCPHSQSLNETELNRSHRRLEFAPEP